MRKQPQSADWVCQFADCGDLAKCSGYCWSTVTFCKRGGVTDQSTTSTAAPLRVFRAPRGRPTSAVRRHLAVSPLGSTTSRELLAVEYVIRRPGARSVTSPQLECSTARPRSSHLMWSHRRIESTRADPVLSQMGSKVSAWRLCGMPFASVEQAEAALPRRELDVVARTESVCATASCQRRSALSST